MLPNLTADTAILAVSAPRHLNVPHYEAPGCHQYWGQSKQVRPASAKPGNVHVRKVRQSDWELMRE
jgi:hypothetical protein